jgi:hypothetical protein
MIKVFIPENKGKSGKINLARGFWVNDTGKVYYDYVKVCNYNQSITGFYYKDLFYNYLNTIKAGYKQESIFIVNEAGQGIIFYNKDRQEVLSNKKIITHLGFRGLKDLIKTTLRDYKGLTITQEARGVYKLEVFYK